jgi:hypothetical protein
MIHILGCVLFLYLMDLFLLNWTLRATGFLNSSEWYVLGWALVISATFLSTTYHDFRHSSISVDPSIASHALIDLFLHLNTCRLERASATILHPPLNLFTHPYLSLPHKTIAIIHCHSFLDFTCVQNL